MSHQLRLLRTARLVRPRREGRQAFYALDDHHVIGLLRDARKHAEESVTARKGPR
jgi:DNA-binding transcriptional ArsR family regulator